MIIKNVPDQVYKIIWTLFVAQQSLSKTVLETKIEESITIDTLISLEESHLVDRYSSSNFVLASKSYGALFSRWDNNQKDILDYVFNFFFLHFKETERYISDRGAAFFPEPRRYSYIFNAFVDFCKFLNSWHHATSKSNIDIFDIKTTAMVDTHKIGFTLDILKQKEIVLCSNNFYYQFKFVD